MRRTVPAAILFLVGICVLVYPHAAMVLDDVVSQQSVEHYQDTVAASDPDRLDRELARATSAPSLRRRPPSEVYDPFSGRVRDDPSNADFLNHDGVFGYIVIPRIGERLPLFLGATKANLARGAAQIAGTSLPVGGLGSHSVIAGHRGYYGTPMFRALDELQEGDLVILHVYGRTLTYRVSGQEVILPTQTERLAVDPTKDQITLLTCTPFGIATHRLLVHAERFTPTEPAVQSPSPVPTAAISTPRPLEAETGVSSAALKHRLGSYAIVLSALAAVLVIGVVIARRSRGRTQRGAPQSPG